MTQKHRVLWTHDGERCGAHVLKRPALFLTAAPPEVLAPWYEARPWAYDVPLLVWHHDPVDTLAMRLLDRATADSGADSYAAHRYVSPGGGPCCVTGPASLLRAAGLGYVETGPDDPWRIRGAVLTARALVAAHQPRGAVWELAAEHTGGALAIGAARATRSAVAVSGETPPRLFTALADAESVDVRAWLDAGVRARLAH